MKKAIIFLIIIFSTFATADTITDLSIAPSGRLNEKISVSGTYNEEDLNSFVLCKFIVTDSNGFKVDRWTDEYTFSDGSIYAEKNLIEPPYYRGDSYDLNVTCGTATETATFGVEQPLSLTHPVQRGWEFIFQENNQAPFMILAGSIGFIVLMIAIVAFLMKTGKAYAS